MQVEATPYHRFTVEDYYRLEEVGILPPDTRVELLNGQVLDMLPIGPFHSGIGSRLHALFASLANGRWIVRSQYPIRLDDQSEPIPDLALVKPRADYYTERHPEPADILLLVEVADSSVNFDQGAKLAAYARAGISEYWIVNLKTKSVEVHRGPSPSGEYRQTSHHRAGDTIGPAAFADAQIAVADLF